MTRRARTVRPAAARQLELIGGLASLVNQTFDLDEIFRAVITRLRDVLAFRRASVALVTDDRRSYYLHTLYDAARDGFLESGGRFPLDAGFTGQAIRTGEPILLDDFRGTAGIRVPGETNVGVIIVPLRVDNQVIGALNLGAPADTTYDDDDLELAVLLGHQIETSLHYSLLLATIRDQGAELEVKHAQVGWERSRLAALVEATDAAVLMISGEQVVHANHAFARLVERPLDVVLGWSVTQVHDALARMLAHPEALGPQTRALAGDGQLADRVEFVAPARRVCQRTVAPVHDPAGGLLGHVIIYRDVTEEVAAAAAKDEFISIVSHELRTPLTSIKTSIDLLSRRDGLSVAQAAELVDIARRNLGRLIRLVDDLLDLSRIKSGRLPAERRPVPIAEAVVRAVDAVGGFAASREVVIHTAAPDERPLVVLGDADRLDQVFVNLLANAIKFSPPGGEVRLVTRAAGDMARLEIADQGPGIPQDQLEAIFDKFHQIESAVTRTHGGAGLGLAISRGIVELLGGRIWAENAPERGARLVVELPLA